MKILARFLFAGALLAPPPALAQLSTVNPSVPAANAPLNSGPVRSNFSATYSDINATRRMFFGASCPSSPLTYQLCANTTGAPNTSLQIWDGSQWVAWGTLNTSAHTFSPASVTCAGLPAFTGDVTKPSASCAQTLANIPTAVPMAGYILATNIAAPSTPTSGKTSLFVDDTGKRLHDINDAGAIGTTVVGDSGTSNNYISAINPSTGVITKSRPACATLSDSGAFCAGTDAASLTGTVASARIAGSYTGITGVGTLTAGATGAGFTIALTTSTVTGTLPGAQFPALTGNVTTSAGSLATTLAVIPSGVTMSGSLLATAIVAPSTPAAGKGSIYVDSTSKNIAVKDDAGVVKHGVQTKASVSNSFATAIDDAGVVTVAQPSFSNISGTIATGQVSGAYSGITGVGTLVSGATGAGFTVALTTSTITGTLPATNLPAFGSGDVSFASGGGAGTIAANAVTNAKLATANDSTIKSNVSGGVAVPSDNTITSVLDKQFGTTQGAVIYRNATVWVALTPGTSGQFLTTQGAAANPTWSSGGAGTGTVTSVSPGYGITSTLTATAPGSAITASGTLYAASLVNAQSGTSYAILDTDRAALITGTNAAAQAYSIAQAGASSAFQAGWYTTIQNNSTNVAGIITVTPATSTINGAATLKIQPGQSAKITSDGTNYQVYGLSSAKQLPGTTTNDAANAGNIGEYVEGTAAASSISLSSSTSKTITSISLTAGDWDISGTTQYLSGGATVISFLETSIGTTTNSINESLGFCTFFYIGSFTSGTVDYLSLNTPTVRVSLSSTTTYYLVSYQSFSASTLAAGGIIRARRVR